MVFTAEADPQSTCELRTSRQICADPAMGTEALAETPTPGLWVLAEPTAVRVTVPGPVITEPTVEAIADEVVAAALEPVTIVVGRVESVTVVLPGKVAIVCPADVVTADAAMAVVLTAEPDPQSTCELRMSRQICADPAMGTEALAETPIPGLRTLVDPDAVAVVPDPAAVVVPA